LKARASKESLLLECSFRDNPSIASVPCDGI